MQRPTLIEVSYQIVIEKKNEFDTIREIYLLEGMFYVAKDSVIYGIVVVVSSGICRV